MADKFNFDKHRGDGVGRNRAKEIVKAAGYAQRNASKQDIEDPANKVDLDNLKGTGE